MSNQDADQASQEQKNQTASIEDLPVDESSQDEIKGGGGHVKVFDGRY